MEQFQNDYQNYLQTGSTMTQAIVSVLCDTITSVGTMLIAHICFNIPYVILAVGPKLRQMDRNLIDAAQDLGCDGRQVFLRVTLPLSVPGIISGITLVFLPAVSSFFIPKLLGGGQYVLIGNLIEDYFISTGDWNFGSAISLIMAIIILASMYFTRKLDRKVGEQEDD